LEQPISRESACEKPRCAWSTQEWRSALEGAIVEVAPSAERLRQREASAATLGAPLKELEERGIPARDWLAAARQEEDVPVVLMMRREAQVGVVNEARVPLA
jgi:hypothetical protein